MHFGWLIFAASTPAFAVEAGGEVAAAARVGISECSSQPGNCTWMHFRDSAIFSPWVQAQPSETVSAKAAIDLRVHGPGEGHGIESSPTPQSWSVRVRDMWVSTRSKHMEFKVGAYRTAWGVANGVSVVDTINPLDIEDPTRFDRRLSVPSATLTAHWETFSASGIVIPFFVPAALPAVPVSVMSGATDLIDERIIGGDETTIGDLASRPVVPNDSLAETTLGIRLRWTASAGDFALSWHHGRDSLPQVNGDLLLVGYQTNNDKVDVGIPLTYPRMDVLGFTARAPIGVGIVGWLETAVVFPEATAASPSAAQLDGLVKLGTIDEMPNPIPTTVTQDGKPLARWILGADRPIGPVRLTAQWMHGFFTERSQSSLNDYALMGVQITLGETVRLDTKAATTSKGHLADISLRYLHDDAVDIKVGGTHIDGDNNSAFGGLRAASNLYTRVSLKF